MAPFSPTDEQRTVIEAREGTVLVLAAVGSGKTTTLAHRLAARLRDGQDPARALALTFTNRAAAHMRRAVAEVVGPAQADRLGLSTFHALCARILRDHAPAVGLPRDFRILDEDDTQELLREIGVGDPRRAMYALGGAASAVPLGEATLSGWARGEFSARDEARPFVEALLQRGAIDFGGLVLVTRALLLEDAACRAAWSGRYDAVLVDEVQDTHLSEYEVLRVLARDARSFCLVGDLDQTIYGWRGSAPRRLMAALERDFAPVRRLELTTSFRATPALLAVADRVADGLGDRESAVRPADPDAGGERPTLHAFATESEEHAHVAAQVDAALAEGADPRRLAVLVRTNQQVADVSAALASRGVPCTTIDQFRFFRRQEVKDALALARLVAHRHDEQAARRVCRRLVKGVGAATVRRVLDDLGVAGLRMADLLDSTAVSRGDPLWGLDAEEVVVLDTETTGVDPAEDEVIEVAAQLVRGGRPVDGAEGRYAALVRNSRPLGGSEAVHHISQERLDAEGRPPGQVLAELQRFIGDRPIAGHNVRFDVAMLQAAARRVGQHLPLPVAWDSLDAARRLLRADRYTLEHLVAHLGIPHTPTHRALDDVLATVALGERLARLARAHAAPRRAALLQHGPRFARLRQTLDRWAQDALRPHELVQRIVDEALRFKYPSEPWRMEHLADLVARLEALDDPALSPPAALARVLDQVALSRDVDQLDRTDGVRVITMHQSKGLEFDRVWVPGLADGTLPGWMALKDGTPEALDEERRVLYVAVTRARQGLHLSWAARNRRGYHQPESQFLADLGDLLDAERMG